MPIELHALPGRCEEASPLSHSCYIPCNAPAKYLVDNGDARPYRMCEACAHHNVHNRRARIVRELTDGE